jgi:hypothetical protein
LGDEQSTVTTVPISTLSRMKEVMDGAREPGESLDITCTDKYVATMAPDSIKEIYLTKVDVNHGSLL